MKIVYKILAAPFVAAVCLLVVGLLALVAVRDITGKFENLRDDKLAAARSLSAVDFKLATVNALLYRTITMIESSDAKAVEAVRRRVGSETDSQIASLKALAPKVAPELAKELDLVVTNLGKYKTNAVQAMVLAESSTGAAASMLASAERSFVSSSDSMHKVAASVDAEVDAMSHQVVATSSRARTTIIGLIVIGASVSLGLAGWMSRRLVQRLAEAVQISEAIARGELDMTLAPGEADELGRLMTSLGNTVNRLGDSLASIQVASGSITTASSEIAAGSQDLSSRTEQTASNLQQTASSVHLLTTSVDGSAAASRQASTLAATASEVAVRGGSMVAEVVATMQQINSSSRQISEIIGVIDGIAFQTNILALNAAVEAARAGEQGRGFAVVASEVRSLAHRSAEAAKQIKSLIGASVEKVELGARLVADTGATMDEVVSAVRQVNDMIASISASANGQASGISGVNRAVDQLDQMTQQNAALVEQSAAAAESLKQQAVLLSGVVSGFRLRA